MRKIGPFVGKDETIGPVVRIGPFVGIGLFGGTGPVVSLTYICSKLKLMGVQSTKWFESYLSNRSQLVNIGKTHSIGHRSSNLRCPTREYSRAFVVFMLCECHGDKQ